MSNILMIPASGSIIFDSQSANSSVISPLSSAPRLSYDNGGGLNITSYTTGTNTLDRFSVDGSAGRLFSISDSLTGTIFSVNDAAGLPIIQVDSDTTDIVNIGPYGTSTFVTSGSSVGIGTAAPISKLHIVDRALAATGALSGSILNLEQTWNTSGTPTAIKLNVTDTASNGSSKFLDFQLGGLTRLNISKAGVLTITDADTNNRASAIRIVQSDRSVNLIPAALGGNANGLGGPVFYQTNSIAGSVVLDALNSNGAISFFRLFNDNVSDTLAQRNGASPQAFRLYNTYTSSTNFERLNLRWDTNVLKIGTEKGSEGGTARDLVFETDATERARVLSTGNILVKDSLELNTLAPTINGVKPALTLYRSGSGGDGVSILCKRENGSELGDLRFTGGATVPSFAINLRYNYTAQYDIASFNLISSNKSSILFGTFNGVSSSTLSIFNSTAGVSNVGIILGNMTTSAGSNMDIQFYSYAGNPHATIRGVYNGGTKFGELSFLTANGLAPVEALRITQLGNVGIGTSIPASNFQVNQSTTGTGTISIAAGETTVTGVGTQFLNTFQAGNTITSAGQTLTILSIASNTSMTTSAAGAEISGAAYTLVGGSRFSVSGNGDISFGGTSLLQKVFNIDGVNATKVYFTGNFAFGGNGLAIRYSQINNSNRLVNACSNNTGATAAYLFGLDGSQQNKGLIYDRNEASISLVCGGGGNSDSYSRRLTILENGNVGIGTTTPGYKLDVNGTTRLGGNVIVDGDSLTMASSGWVQTWGLSYSGPTTHRLSSNYDLELIGGGESRGVTIRAGVDTARFTSGKVGIGTLTPTARLDIADTSLASGGSEGSVLNLSQTWNTSGTPTAIKLNVTNTASNPASNLMDLQVGAVSMFKVNKDGAVSLNSLDKPLGTLLINSTSVAGATIYGNTRIQAGSLNFNANLYLYPDDANILAQRNSINPQAFRLYNTYTDATTFERLNIKWDANVLKIGTEKGSVGGTVRNLEMDFPILFLSRPLSLADTRTVHFSFNSGGNYIGSFFEVTNYINIIRLNANATDGQNILFKFGNSDLGSKIGNNGVDQKQLVFNNLNTSSGSMRWIMGSTEVIRLTQEGNLGIGTISPTSKFQVTNGDIEVETIASGLILKSPDGTRYRVTVANGGTLSVAAV